MRTACIGILLTLCILAGAVPVADASAIETVNCRRDPGELTAALSGAAPGATLVIHGTCVGSFTIDRNVTLAGRGAHATLDAARAGTVVAVEPGVNAVITNLTITGGGGRPGGVRNEGTLTLVGARVSDNEGLPASGQVAESPLGAGGGTGGILNLGSLTIRDSEIVANIGGGDAVAYGLAGVGGILSTAQFHLVEGVRVFDAASLDVTDSFVRGNRGGSTPTGGSPGGIWSAGLPFGAHGDGASMTLTGTTVEDNSAGNSASGVGGIWITGISTPQAIVRTVVRQNLGLGVSAFMLDAGDSTITENEGGGVQRIADGAIAFTNTNVFANVPFNCINFSQPGCAAPST